MALGKGLSALINTDIYEKEVQVESAKTTVPQKQIKEVTKKSASKQAKQNETKASKEPVKEKDIEHIQTSRHGKIPYREVNIDDIEPNAFQPRMVITEESLRGLVESIKQNGFFAPILVKEKGNKYMIIAGERRWRAAKIAGVKIIPIVINHSNDAQLMSMALVENIQRKDLNAIEEGMAFEHLRTEYGMTMTEIAKRVGLHQETIGDRIRLLKLPVSIQELLLEDKLTPQHTSAIEKLNNEAAMLAVSKMVLRDRLSAEKTHELVHKLMEGMGLTTSSKPVEEFKQKYQYVLDGIKNKLGWKASLTRKQNGGATLSISFNSEQEIKDFYSKLDRESKS